MLYEVGGVVAWTYYDVVGQLLEALEGHLPPEKPEEPLEEKSGELSPLEASEPEEE
jgi:hypothetical protein